MTELYLLTQLIEQADIGVLKQLIQLLAAKDPVAKQECLDFLRQRAALPSQTVTEVDAEEMWALWDGVESDLSDFDERGGGPKDMEDYVSECLVQIEELLKERDILKEERAALVEEVLPFICSHNTSMVDLLYDIAYAACKDREDWLYLAESLEATGKDWPMDHARRIYRAIGEHEKYLQLRAKKMVYGSDYYDLVKFYRERGEEGKALAVAQEGMVKAQGRMDELRAFMAQRAPAKYGEF